MNGSNLTIVSRDLSATVGSSTGSHGERVEVRNSGTRPFNDPLDRLVAELSAARSYNIHSLGLILGQVLKNTGNSVRRQTFKRLGDLLKTYTVPAVSEVAVI